MKSFRLCVPPQVTKHVGQKTHPVGDLLTLRCGPGFGAGELNETTLTGVRFRDLFVAHYNPDGSLAWATSAGVTSPMDAIAVAAYPDGSSVVTGTFTSLATFGAGEANETTLTSASRDIFVARYRVNPDPVPVIEQLALAVIELNLLFGIENSLDVKLNRALAALIDANLNNDVSAINALQAFINETQAQSGIWIPVENANALISAAQAILALL